jgi:hypothetical protein
MNRLKLGQGGPVLDGIPVGINSTEMVLTQSGDTLYVAFNGDPNEKCDGGAAVIEISEAECCEILWRDQDGCPPCEDECLVLATIRNYRFGDRLLPQTDPPADVAKDRESKIARIDNRLGRRILPSTQLIAEAVECLCELGTGGGGLRGPQGPPGADGQGVSDVVVQHHECDPQDPDAPLPPSTFDPNTGALTIHVRDGCDGNPGPPGTDGKGINDVVVQHHECDPDNPHAPLPPSKFDPTSRVLTIHVRNGCDGKQGPPGDPGKGIDDVVVKFVDCEHDGSATIIEQDGRRILILEIPTNCQRGLGHICAINWRHGEFIEEATVDRHQGIIVAFDVPVWNADLHAHSVRVLGTDPENNGLFECWCELLPEQIVGLRLPDICVIPEFRPDNFVINNPLAAVNAVWFRFRTRPRPGIYRVVVVGDFIRRVESDGQPGRAIDADHLPPWLPVRKITGDGVEGGHFESWFRVRQ